jgi:hypothetical protein
MPDKPVGTSQAPAAQPEWAEVTDPDWKPAFTKTQAGLSLAFSGLCPRCQHQTYFAIPIVRPDAAGATVRSAPEPFWMYCACGYPHPGHPDDDNSCGAYWPYEAEL